MGALEEGSKAVATVAESMKTSPLAIALLLVNIGFLAFAAYVLGHVASNAAERNKNQMELIEHLVRDIRDCRQDAPATPPFPNPRPREAPT